MMSELFITDLKGEIISVEFNSKHELRKIYHALLPILKSEFDIKTLDGGVFGLEILDMADFSETLFFKACQLILKACKDDELLAPYTQELKQKLEADPRFINAQEKPAN